MGVSSTHSNLYKGLFIKSWWVIFFYLLSFLIFDQAMTRKRQEQARLIERERILKERTTMALAQQKQLHMALSCQEDPFYIEMVLMKRLGLVPKGYTKVHFSRKVAE